MATHRLIYATSGQTLTHTPGTHQASADLELHDMTVGESSAGRVLHSETVAVDDASAMIVADAGPSQTNPRQLFVSTTSGFTVGHWYQAYDTTTGRAEAFIVDGIAVGDYLLTKHPLVTAFGDSASIRGLELVSSALDLSIVSDESRLQNDWPMRAVWVYADGSVVQEQARLVRHSSGDFDVSAVQADVLRLFPDIYTRTEHLGRNVLPDYIAASVSQLETRLDGRGIDPSKWLTGRSGHWATVWHVLRHVAYLGNAPANQDPAEFQRYATDELRRYWDELLIGVSPVESQAIEPVTDTAYAKQDESISRSPITL